MLRYARKVKTVKKDVEHTFYGKGTFLRKVKGPRVLQWQDAEGQWHDVDEVEIEEEDTDGTEG